MAAVSASMRELTEEAGGFARTAGGSLLGGADAGGLEDSGAGPTSAAGSLSFGRAPGRAAPRILTDSAAALAKRSAASRYIRADAGLSGWRDNDRACWAARSPCLNFARPDAPCATALERSCTALSCA